MKRFALIIVALALVCFFATSPEPLGPTLSSGVERAHSIVSATVEKLKELRDDLAHDNAQDGYAEDDPAQDDYAEDDAIQDDYVQDDAAQDGYAEGDGMQDASTPATTSADLALIPTDDYGSSYVFSYGGEEFVAYFDTYSWRVYDSYKITDHADIVAICQMLIDEHPVYGSDWVSYRTADDMAFEWEQHNIAYKLLPESSEWRDDAKDVDLDPYDQGLTFTEMYERRTGSTLGF